MVSSRRLPCKLESRVPFKAGGDVFHRLFTTNPQHLASINPAKVQRCHLHQGSFDTNGSVTEWKFILDGKEHTSTTILQGVDEEKKQISYKVIEGELVELYNNLVITYHVETENGVDYITRTIDYELASPETPHPLSILMFGIEFHQELEGHIFG